MLIRIRSNLGTWKLTVDGNITIKELKTLIFNEFNFSTEVTPEHIRLSSEMVEGRGLYSDSSSSLQQLGIKHGSIVYITSKLNQVIIEKSYVGEDGMMIEAGTKISVEKIDTPPSIVNNTSTTPPEKQPLDQENDVVPSITPSHHQKNTSTIATDDSSQMTTQPTLTDDEAIAKLLEEDVKSFHNNSDEAYQQSLSPNIRPPDESKNMRLFDHDDMHTDMSLGGGPDLTEFIRQYLNPPPMDISATVTRRVQRHGREPLQTLASTTQSKQFEKPKKSKFEAPVMSQDVLENAKAAGLSEEEIREMFDAEYAEKLQADVLSNDFSDSERESGDVNAGSGGVSEVSFRNHNRFEDLTLDDDKDQGEGSREKDKIDNFIATGGRYQPELKESFVSEEEEKLIQEILASSLADVATRNEEEDEVWEQMHTESRVQIDEPDNDNDGDNHNDNDHDNNCPYVMEYMSPSDSGGLDVVGRPVAPAVRGGAGAGVGSKGVDRQKKHKGPKSYSKTNQNSKVYNSTLQNTSRRTNHGAAGPPVGGGLALEGRRMDVGESTSASNTKSRTRDKQTAETRNLATPNIPNERRHGRGMRVTHAGSSSQNAHSSNSPPSLRPRSTLPRPVSDVQIQFGSSISSSRIPSSEQSDTQNPRTEGVNEGSWSGGGSALNDSMDDEVMAWALKMSAMDTGGVSSTVSAPVSSRHSGPDSGSIATAQRSTVTGVGITTSSRQWGDPSTQREPPRTRTGPSERAEQLLQRLNAATSAATLTPLSSSASSTSVDTAARVTATGSSSISGNSRSRSGSSGGGVSRGGGGGSDYSVPSRDVVSTMDEDEQLAWALQQSML